jgi:hypothetical protein
MTNKAIVDTELKKRKFRWELNLGYLHRNVACSSRLHDKSVLQQHLSTHSEDTGK